MPGSTDINCSAVSQLPIHACMHVFNYSITINCERLFVLVLSQSMSKVYNFDNSYFFQTYKNMFKTKHEVLL